MGIDRLRQDLLAAALSSRARRHSLLGKTSRPGHVDSCLSLNLGFDLPPALWQDRHGKRIAIDHLTRGSVSPPNEGRD